MKRFFVVLSLCMMNYALCTAQIGTWRNYLAYSDIQQIQAADNYLFVMASNGLYQYNKNDQSITTYDKINGMSDVGITNIRWCPQAKRLVVIYDNSNIDLLETNGNIINVSDIYLKSVVGGKTIYNVTISGQYAYLACDFGVVKMDVKQALISETYMLGFSVYAIAFENNNIYAQNLKYKLVNGVQTLDEENIWTADMSSNLIDANNWTKTDVHPSFDQDMTDYNANIELVRTLKPGGPGHNVFGFMRLINNKLFTCNGDFDNSVPIQVFNGSDWQIYEYEGISQKTGFNYFGIYCLDVDPANENHVFAGSRNGLYEYLNGQFVKFYNSTNSPIEAYNGKSTNNQLVTGVKYDQNGNLWILNSQAPTTSLLKYANNEFTKYNKSEIMKLNDSGYTNKSNGMLSNIIIDSQGLMWFCNNNWMLPAFYRYNIDDDVIRAYESFTNQDGTRIELSGGVRCVVEDLNNDLWIGSTSGPFVLERSQADASSPVYTQVKVPRNDGTNYADYLLAGVSITDIAVDAAGRKWFATDNNGVYLISADNMTQIEHFTTENSLLLSDNINAITINNETGEVFFATAKGLCSYISDVSKPNEDMTKDNVYAYPNPVEPGYTGLITVTGLSMNADVKIVSSNGALIAEGRSNGGTFTWDGNDQKGRRVASGVYMVVTATSDGNKGTVCKIAIIN